MMFRKPGHLFTGVYQYPYEAGSITIYGCGKTANLVFKLENGTTRDNSPVTLTVDTLQELEKKYPAIQHTARHTAEEHLINTWHTKKSYGCLIKYATNHAQALAYCSDDNLEGDINILSKYTSDYFKEVSYFKERKFCDDLQKEHGLTITDLRNLPGMNQLKLSLLLQHEDRMKVLLKSNFTFADFARMNGHDLSKLLRGEPSCNLLPYYKIT